MAADSNFTRVDSLKLKHHIYQRIGHQRAEKYFDQLNKFLGLKLSKAEFANSCIRTIGKDNISLHNRLIRSILRNACQAKIPPRKCGKAEPHNGKATNGHSRSYLPSLYRDAFPPSPRKCRSPMSRDRKIRDRPSPLGPLGKSPSLTVEETVSRLHEQQGAAPPLGPVEEGEEVEQFAVDPTLPRWSSITAPLGVSFNVGSESRGTRFDETCQSSGELPDTKSLGSCLEKKLALEGITISLDGANLLNKSLDVFLKQIISCSIGIARSRCEDSFIDRGESNGQMVTGFNAISPGSYVGNPTQPTYASMLDFRVAMETSPSILGEDRSILLERINNYGLQ